MSTFLFELGTEEIPASMVEAGLLQLRDGLVQLLTDQQVEHGDVLTYSSPRRLTVLIDGLPENQADRSEVVMGPPTSVAFDDAGNPTPAAHGFARKLGVDVAALERRQTPRGEYLVVEALRKGAAVVEILTSGLPAAIKGINWPKTMYWSESRFRFIRPLRWFVVMWNDQHLAFEFEGVKSQTYSRGHRFLGDPEPVIPSPPAYVDALRKNFVLVDAGERRRRVEAGLLDALPEGLSVQPDPGLLDTVCILNEYPSVLRGEFDPRFLEIPSEVLITVMRHHQKYFAVVDDKGQLQNHFLTVLNTDGDPDGLIRSGHEKVLKARLEDASFFWINDQKQSLDDRVDGLSQVMFQQQLGSYGEKTQRIQTICAGLDNDNDLQTAARLAKADLTTEMVFEMSELQGIMGGLYARQEGLPETVWRAIYEHYQPLSMDDAVPPSRQGALLSLSDKLDTVVGCFSVGIQPTGSSDPFALRRQGQGIVRILLEHDLNNSLESLVALALQGLSAGSKHEEVTGAVLDFMTKRVRFVFQELGIQYDVLNAVLFDGVHSVPQALARASALQQIRGEGDFEALAIAFKRIRNILGKQSSGIPMVVIDLLEEPAEKGLFEAFQLVSPKVDQCLGSGQYREGLGLIAGLRQPVDQFFDEVMVMAPDEQLRANRLKLLSDISDLFLQFADISEIVRTE